MKHSVLLRLVFGLSMIWQIRLEDVEVDVNGYVLYCPCMGRFGNQAEQFLGSIAFAKALGRTLVLPAWVCYSERRPFQSEQVAFNQWFKVNPLKKYYDKVMTMEYFMEKLATKVWSTTERKGFCYQYRDGKSECSMKEGNPFGPFWDHYGINFVGSVKHQGLLWHIENEQTREEWLQRFPGNQYPVMAFQGAPGSFPSLTQHHFIHKYIEFSDYLSRKADTYIKQQIGGKKYVAIHLRNGIDITRVCDELEKYPSLFASEQCTQHTKDGKLTYAMCHPSKQEIVKRVKKAIKQSKAEALFIATDNDAMIEIFKKELKRMKVSIHQRKSTGEVEDPIIDIALLSKADYFLGNCVSTFSAFVRRQREVRNQPVGFFGIDYPEKNKKVEL